MLGPGAGESAHEPFKNHQSGGYEPCWSSKPDVLGTPLSGGSLKSGIPNVGSNTLLLWEKLQLLNPLLIMDQRWVYHKIVSVFPMYFDMVFPMFARCEELMLPGFRVFFFSRGNYSIDIAIDLVCPC